MSKPKTGLPRFLFCSNPAVNDNEYILHTAKPVILVKIIKEGGLKALVEQTFTECLPEDAETIAAEALKKYLYGQARSED